MKIARITYSNNNDFKADFICENCGHTFNAWGYSDGNFYQNVMPNATCPECKKNSLGETYEETEKRLGRGYRI